MPADLSANESGIITEIIKKLFHISQDNTEHIVRKCAHFSEYFILGTLISADCILYIRRPVSLFSLFAGLLTPQIDESIQLFSPGRSGELFDVWLDFTGFLTGTIFLSVIFYIVSKNKGIKPKQI